MSKFLKLLNSVLIEQEIPEVEPEAKPETEKKPVKLDSNISSALPEEEDVAMDLIKYKTLLKALKEALYKVYTNNLSKQRDISNINLETDTLKELQNKESELMSFLDSKDFIKSTEE